MKLDEMGTGTASMGKEGHGEEEMTVLQMGYQIMSFAQGTLIVVLTTLRGGMKQAHEAKDENKERRGRWEAIL